ncbi:MAG: hypothetical protein M3Y41_22395 [Pseudomonadota bacterium]|nr:hypothetical protein [Pseudomonadota bacterium]
MQTATSLPALSLRPRIARLGRSRLVLGSAALGVIAAAAVWQWSWLVAIGVAPLLLSVAPCAAMCGLGLCMHHMGSRACTPAPQDQPLQAPSTTQET